LSSTTAPTPDPNPPAKARRSRWARLVAWIAGSIAALIVLGIVAAAILLHSARFHRYLLNVAENKASAMLGAKVQLQNFTPHLSNLSLDLYGITVHGAPPFPNPPLLLVQHVEVGIRVVSIWHAKWYLNNLRIDRPVARIYTGPNGASNIPAFKSGGGGGSTNVFSVGIRHAVLDHGEVYYNNRKSKLKANLHNLEFRAAFDKPQQKYTGELSYRNGLLQTGTFRPIQHNFDAKFTATPTTFDLKQATITSGKSQFMLSATVKDYSKPNVFGRYHATINGGELGRVLRDPSLPSGVVRTSGTIAYQSQPNVPPLDSVAVEGTVTSRQLTVQASNTRTNVRDIVAQYSFANGNLSVRNFRARLLGGTVTATLQTSNIGGVSRSKLKATLHGLSLADLKRVAPSSVSTRAVRLGGTVNGTASATWGETLKSLVAHVNATIQGNVSRTGALIPVSGSIHGTYSAAQKSFSLSNSYLQLPQTRLALNGVLGAHGGGNAGLAIHLHSADLRELESVADLVHTSAPGQQAPLSLGLAGTATFNGVVRGSTSAPVLTGNLTVADLQFRGTKWKRLTAHVELSRSLVSLQDADLESATGGQMTLNASAHLVNGSFSKQSPVQIDLHAARIDIARLEKIAGSSLPASGMLTANIRAHGTIQNPVGQVSATLTAAKIEGQPVHSAHVTFTAADGDVHARLAIDVAGGTVHSTVTVRPSAKTYIAQLTAAGIRIAKLEPLQAHNIDATGTVNLQGSGKGVWTNPQFDATLTIPRLQVKQQTIEDINLQMGVANHAATASLHSQAVGTSTQASAKVDLTGEYMASATLDTQAIPLGPLLAAYAPSEASGLAGETAVHATLHGPLKNPKLLQAQITVPVLKVNYGSKVHLAAASPIHLEYKNGTIDLQRATIQGTDTNLEVQGSIPIASHGPPSILIKGDVDLKLAQLMNPDIQSSGQVKFEIDTYHAQAGSSALGQVRIVNASFTNDDLPVGMEHGNGVLTLTRDRLNVQSFQAKIGGGTLTAQGGVTYRPSIQFDLGATANGVRLLYPQGLREQFDANIRLTGSEKNAVLGGRVQVQDMSFTPEFDLMGFVGNLSGGVAAPPAQGFAQNLQLNLGISTVNNLNLVSRTVSIDGTANLQVRGTAANPVILGRISLTDGDLIFNGNRYTLGGGTIEFVNPAETQPVVNLAVNTTIQQYNIHLRFNGPTDQLRTNYSSDPSLPEADIINLLAFGNTTEASANNPTPANQQAMSLVASQVSSQITSRVSKIAGISQLSINPVLNGGTTQGPAGAIISIQQRVTGNLFVTYSTNVASTQNQVIMGEYKLSRKTSISATRDQNGGFGFDVLRKRKW